MIIDAKHINYIPGMDMVNQRLGEGYRTGWGIVVGGHYWGAKDGMSTNC